MVERQPNTQYVLSWSGGKDSTACLQAIKLLGYPLDRIVKADIWATDTIRGEDPETVAWEAEAEQRIYDLYGIRVEHFCAMTTPEKKLRSQISKVERERERERESSVNRQTKARMTDASSPTKTDCIGQSQSTPQDLKTESGFPEDSLTKRGLGVSETSNLTFSTKSEKLTYEDVFYRRMTGRSAHEGELYGYPMLVAPWCKGELKISALNAANAQPATGRIYGFPIPNGPHCRSWLKTSCFPMSA